MKLISCSLYNSWVTHKGSAGLDDRKLNPEGSISKLAAGHYDLDNLAKEITDLFSKHNYQLKTETNTPLGQLVIKNNGTSKIALNDDLAKLFGTEKYLPTITIIKCIITTTAYFIHCDLMDRNFNFVNNKKSDLLAKIDVIGKPYEKDIMLLPNSLFETARQVLMLTVSLSASEIKMGSFLTSKAWS